MGFDISLEKKLTEIAEYRFSESERPFIEEYCLALANDNKSVVADYESFGDSLRQILMNKYAYERGLASFGFTEKRFNEHGWLDRAIFSECKEFSFGTKVKACGRNVVSIGRCPNGKWACSTHLAVSNEGRGSVLSVYDKPYASRRDCLCAALEEMINWHTEKNDPKTSKVIAEATEMLDEVMGRKHKQISIFDFMSEK